MSRLWRGRQERIASGLPPYADAELADVTGPHDVALLPAGPAFGLAFETVGWGGDPAQRAIFGHAGRDFGTLVRILAQDRWHVVNDVAAYEAANNPAGGPVDSNPYGLLGGPLLHTVADAGANALLQVLPGGKGRTIATFGSRPDADTDAVPTSWCGDWMVRMTLAN